MRASVRIIGAGLFCLTGSASAVAQGTLPATAPTSVSDLPSARPDGIQSRAIQSGAVQSGTPSGTSHVEWTGSTLAIDGSGDSLRNILLQVKQATGMKVTGGIPDERVFGKYGPAPVQTVLAQLFNGLSVNLMLVNDSPTRPKELVLTARTGGVTPPMASPIRSDEGSSRPDGMNFPGRRSQLPDQQPQQLPPGQNAGQPGMPPSNGAQGSPAAPPNTPAGDQGTTSTDNSNADANGTSNGTKTPEQIFEELRRRQQQGSGTVQ